MKNHTLIIFCILIPIFALSQDFSYERYKEISDDTSRVGLIEKIIYDNNRKESIDIIKYYSSNGELRKYRRYFENISEVYSCEYDSLKRLCFIKCYSTAYGCLSQVRYNYRDNKVVSSVGYHKNSFFETYYDYDSNDRISKETQYRDNTLYSVFNYNYFSDSLVKTESLFRHGDLSPFIETTILSRGDSLIEIKRGDNYFSRRITIFDSGSKSSLSYDEYLGGELNISYIETYKKNVSGEIYTELNGKVIAVTRASDKRSTIFVIEPCTNSFRSPPPSR